MKDPARTVAHKGSVLLFVALMLVSACTRSYDETIAGAVVPVPSAMKRTAEKPAEVSLLGFGAGQATFVGDMDTGEIVEFYKKELPARGWQPNMNLRSGGALLAYSKEGKTLLIGVDRQNGESRLSVAVGGVNR